MESLAKFFTGIFEKSSLSWKLIFLLLVVVGVFSFEAYTEKFKLERIDNQLEVVEKLVELEKKVESLPKDSKVRTYFLKVLENTQNSTVNLPVELAGVLDWSKLFYLYLPWLILILIVLVSNTKDKLVVTSNIMIVASILATIGYLLPAFEYSGFIKYWYPWGAMILTISLLAIYQKRNGS